MKEKVFKPNTKTVIPTMITLYILVIIGGSVMTFYFGYAMEEWIKFMKTSLIYIIVCLIIFVSIKSQKMIINEKEIMLKVIGITRHKIKLTEIEEIRKGKMSGNPIMEIETRVKGYKRIAPFPYLPFEEAWKVVIEYIKENQGEEVIGEMKMKREPGELRNWEKWNK